jgi:tripartite-type tricarboxylate transporter receptor subunit TctC
MRWPGSWRTGCPQRSARPWWWTTGAAEAAAASRNPQLPDVPTTAEAGFPKLVSIFWLGLFAPAGTPDGIVEKLNAVVNQAFQAPDIRARFADLGAELKVGPRQEFAAFINSEIKRWSAITAPAGITVD